MRKRASRNPTLLIRVAGCHAVCAASAKKDDERRSNIDRAIEALQAATAKDFKDADENVGTIVFQKKEKK